LVRYNGRGIAPGALLGRAFAEFAATGDARALPLPFVDATSDLLANIKSFGYELGSTAFHLLDAR
jgi:hypothetical protein